MAAEELNIGLTVTADQSGGRKLLKIPKDITASNLRKLVSEATNIPLAGLHVIFRGKIIAESDKMAVEEFKLSEDCVLHCMGKPVAGASASSTEAATPPIAAAAAGSSVTIPAASAAAVPTASAPANTLQAAFAKLKSSNSAQVYMTGVTTLDKILSNIINHPMEEKYRKVKKHNAAFQKRLGGLVGGDDAMMAAGFTTETESDSGEEIYMMQASAEKWPALVAAKATTEQAARQAKAAMGAPAPHPPLQPMTGGMPNFGGFPGFGGGAAGMPDMGSPQMQQAAAAMMQDPQAIQAMLQVNFEIMFRIVKELSGEECLGLRGNEYCVLINFFLFGFCSRFFLKL